MENTKVHYFLGAWLDYFIPCGKELSNCHILGDKYRVTKNRTKVTCETCLKIFKK